jgi:hypothetical protein
VSNAAQIVGRVEQRPDHIATQIGDAAGDVGIDVDVAGPGRVDHERPDIILDRYQQPAGMLGAVLEVEGIGQVPAVHVVGLILLKTLNEVSVRA